MIYTSITVKIGNNGVATASNKVVLYRGDREVEIQMTLTGNPFIVKESTFAQLIIRREDAAPIITGIAPLKNSKVVLTITEDNIDELTEVGTYAYQIRLYDDDMSARVTLPPVENGIEVREPIVDEASGAIGRAMINYSLISRPFAISDDPPTFNEYDEYNKTYWRDGDFITDVKMNKIEDALYTINQRVLSNAESAYISSNMLQDQKVGIGESLDITFDFVSPNQGRGTLKVMVNGVQKISQYVEQETTTITLPEDFFTKGENKVSLFVIDRAGKTSNELIFVVRYGSTEITPDFDAYTAYQRGASVRYYFIPSALDTSMALTFYMVIDGEVKPGIECKSDTRGYYTFPNNLSVGAHACQAYIVDADGTQSNIHEFNLVIIDAYSIVVASDTKNPTIEEGDQLTLDYKVYMQTGDRFIVKIYVDDNLISTGECGLETNYYRTSSLSVGAHVIKVEVWDPDEVVSDYVIWNVSVTEASFENIMPATAAGIYLATAKDHSNSDANRDKWIGYDQDGNEIVAQLNDFTYSGEDGWIRNELIFNGIASAEIPVKPLANNARYGMTLDIEFTTKPIGVEDALVLDLWDYEKDCGIKITTEQLRLRSADGNEASLYFQEDTNTSAMFIIDRNEKKAKIYLNGVMCSAFNLNDYETGGQMVLEDFTVNSNIKLGGSGYSKIRNLRVYEVALTTDEIINNFISNKETKAEQKELVDFQQGLHLPTLTIYCDFSGLGKDDKKPCKIVYSSTDEEKYGPSFTLDHKMSSCQYQGTSSMAYPIKNYRINLADENGDKWKYAFPYGKPEHRFTLKADFMSSGHWQNTGLTKWVNDNLYNYNEKDEKSMNPKKWFDLQNGGSIKDTRECIYGFPCRLILVNDGTTPLNEGQNEPTPGNTKDMGIFNFNHDKDATDTMGFDQDNFPNCMSFEVTANSDTSAGAFMSFDVRRIDYAIETNWDRKWIYTDYIPISEFKLADNRLLLSNITSKDNLISKVTYNAYDENYNSITVGLNNIIPENVKYMNCNFTMTEISDEVVEKLKNGDLSLDGRTIYLGEKVYDGHDVNKLPRKGFYTLQDDELEYLQQSFEMRFPDADDYNDWYGYLGINAGTMVTDYIIENGGYSTMYWNWHWADSVLSIQSTHTIKSIECYYYDEFLANVAFNKTEGTARLIDGTNKIRFIFEQIPDSFHVNGTKYIFGKVSSKLDVVDPYLGEEISPNYGLKRLIDWVDKCTDEEFVNDFEQYFHKDYTLRYYLLVITLGMVDNLGKNMMLDSWDGQIWMPRFYDCDTICSYDNTGDIAFDVDIEMEQGYWNTSSSRLWTRIRDLMHADLVVKYNDMRQNGLSYQSLMDCFYGEQISKIPQKYYNMDFDVKYAPFGDSYMGMAHGDGYEHLKRWLKKRLLFTDSLFDYAPSYNNDILTIRANTTEEMTIYIETYDPVYQHVSWYNGQMDKKKIDGKIAVTFSGKAMAATDQEVLIYGGSNVKKISGISSMNPGELLIGSATRLAELDVSNCPILTNINQNKANLSPHKQILKINLSNCPMLGGNLRINESPLVQEIDISNTAISGINFAPKLRNLKRLKMSGCKELTSIDLSCWDTRNVINMESMFENCESLTAIDTTGWDTKNVTNMNSVFYSCKKLTSIKSLENWDVSNVTDMRYMFYNCDSLTSLDLSKWDTKNVTNMASMFYDSDVLTSLDLSGWDTGKVTTMEQMFRNCTKLTSIKGISDWNTGKVTSIYSMFQSCSNLTSLDLSGWDTKNVNNMYQMFYNCPALTSLDLSGWDTRNVTNVIGTFSGCSALTSIKGIGDWDTGKINNMQVMFYGCKALTSLDLSSWNTSLVTNMHSMFYGCSGLTSLNLSDWDIGKVTSINSMCNGCSNLSEINMENWSADNITKVVPYLPTRPANAPGELATRNITDELIASLNAKYWFTVYGSVVARYIATSEDCIPTFNSGYDYLTYVTTLSDGKHQILIRSWDDFSSVSFRDKTSLYSVEKLEVTSAVTSMNSMFRGCNQLQSIEGIGDWDTSAVTSMNYTFYDCSKLTSLDLSDWDTKNVTGMNAMFNSCKALTSLDVSDWDTGKVTNMTYMFYGCSGLTSLDVSDWDTGTVATMSYMFYSCSGLTSLDLSGWDTGKVTTMAYMFNNCNVLTSIEGIGDWDTGTVTDMTYMFYGCNELTSLDLSKWDTGNVTTMYYMFTNCNHLSSLDLSGWDTGNVTGMGAMFNNCIALTSIEGISDWDVKNVSNMAGMFYGCTGLTSLDLSKWVTSNVTTMSIMFQGCNKLTSIEGIEDWDTGEVSVMNGIFQGCSALTSLDLSGWDTGVVNNMANMFTNCNSLTSLDATGWDTGAVNTMSYMFQGCSNLTSIEGIGDWDTGAVTIMTAMFNGCSQLQSLDVSGWDIGVVHTMTNMFYGCTNLASINCENWTEENLTKIVPSLPTRPADAPGEIIARVVSDILMNTLAAINWTLIFGEVIARYRAGSVDTVPTFNSDYQYAKYTTGLGEGKYEIVLRSWEDFSSVSFNGKSDLYSIEYLQVTNKVNTLNNIFHSCYSLTTLEGIEGWDTGAVTNMASMFNNCPALTSLEGIEDWDTGKVTNMSYMFLGCSKLTSLDLSGWDTKNVTNMSNMFAGCSQLQSLDVSGWDTGEVTNMSYMFYACRALTSLDLSGWDTSKVTTMAAMFQNCSNLTSLDLSDLDTGAVTNMTDMFQDCSKLTSLEGIEDWDTSKVTGMSYMFNGCSQLQSLDVSGWDTGEVTNATGMFNNCYGLTSLDLSDWDTGAVTNMSSMFYGCSGLTSLDVSGWDTGKVTNMNNMFAGCSSLSSLDTTGWILSTVDSMGNTFQGCSKLETIAGIEDWSCDSLTTLYAAFYGCSSLKSLDLSKWSINKLANVQMAFQGCASLTSLDLSNWNALTISNMANMFNGTTSLKTLKLFDWDRSKAQVAASTLPMGAGDNEVVINSTIVVPTGWILVNPNEIAKYVCTSSGVLPSFNSEFTAYTPSEVNNGDGTYTTSISLNDLNDRPTKISFSDKSSLTRIIRLDIKGVTDMGSMFQGCSNLTSIEGIGDWDTGAVTDMYNMFRNCPALTSLDVSGWDTRNVTDMSNMFYGCKALTSIEGIGDWDTGKVTDMTNMFQGCSKLTSLDLSDWDTGKVSSMYGMFDGCSKLTSLDVSGWDTGAVTTMTYMFYSCSKLTSLDVSGWDTGLVGSMSSMFNGCNQLQSLEGIGDWDTGAVGNMYNMFYGCSNLTSLDLSGWDTGKVTDMSYMFRNCYALTSLDVSGWDTGEVTTMYNMFFGCSGLTSLDLSGWDTGAVTSMGSMFNGCSNLTSLDLSGWTNALTQTAVNSLPVGNGTNELIVSIAVTAPTGWILINPYEIARYVCTSSGVLPSFNSGFTAYTSSEANNGDGTYTTSIVLNDLNNRPTIISFSGKSSLTRIIRLDIKGVTDISSMFQSCSNLTSLDLSGWDAGKVTNMYAMFQNCSSLTSLDVSGWDTGLVTNMSNMFYNCSRLTSIEGIGDWDTGAVTNMVHMFHGCTNLTSLDLSGWDTSAVTYMSYMFYNCSGPTSLDLSGWDTGLVTDMSNMFQGCSNLTSIVGIGDWDTGEVTNMTGMFDSCSKLTSLDLSGWDTSKVTNMSSMFYSCSGLTSLNLLDWDTGAVNSMAYMFHSCNKLTSLNLSGWDTGAVNTMTYMFTYCSNLTSLDVSGWDTGAVTVMSYMFQYCSKLTSLDLSDWDTGKVANMSGMFSSCSKLTSLDSMMNISTNLSLSSTQLDVSSLLDVIDNLATVTSAKTLSIGTMLLIKLTEEQVAVATNKGWSVG